MANDGLKDQYKVEGYGKRTSYDGPYHPSADFDPALVYAHAGDPEAQAQYQEELVELDEAHLVRYQEELDED